MQWKRMGVITLSVVLVAVPAYSIPRCRSGCLGTADHDDG